MSRTENDNISSLATDQVMFGSEVTIETCDTFLNLNLFYFIRPMSLIFFIQK